LRKGQPGLGLLGEDGSTRLRTVRSIHKKARQQVPGLPTFNRVRAC
jgi:hypothetical protein